MGQEHSPSLGTHGLASSSSEQLYSFGRRWESDYYRSGSAQPGYRELMVRHLAEAGLVVDGYTGYRRYASPSRSLWIIRLAAVAEWL
ncbi:hypothetical protein [Paenibacillus odorifer]|uniref:hypothetical protein n=1 Tax=Paenibacillus odorifer TaxID=189426 RepID=UPI0032E371C7